MSILEFDFFSLTKKLVFGIAVRFLPLEKVHEATHFRLFLGRAVAQLGSALEWGSRGRGFESRRPDWRSGPCRHGSRGILSRGGAFVSAGEIALDVLFSIAKFSVVLASSAVFKLACQLVLYEVLDFCFTQCWVARYNYLCPECRAGSDRVADKRRCSKL